MAAEAIVAAQALGAMTSFKGAKNAARAAQDVANYNAEVARGEAVLLARAKRDEEANLRRQGKALDSAQQVATAAGGIEQKGNPMTVLADTFFSIERDAARLRYAGDIEQLQKMAEVDLTLAEGRSQVAAANSEAYSSLLGDVASTYTTYKAIG